MRSIRLYYNGLLGSRSSVMLDMRHSHYLADVLRLAIGDPVVLFNGNGKEYQGFLASIQRKRIYIQIEKVRAAPTESPLFIELGQSLLRSEKMDWVIQKAVELGVNIITPLMTQYNQIKLSEQKKETRMQHWCGIIESACEQSGRAFLPELRPVQSLSEWLVYKHRGLGFICDPRFDRTLDSYLSKAPKAACLLIGPEGGLSDDEVSEAKQAGFSGLSLGPRILRTETAGLVALSMLQYAFGDVGIHLSPGSNNR